MKKLNFDEEGNAKIEDCKQFELEDFKPRKLGENYFDEVGFNEPIIIYPQEIEPAVHNFIKHLIQKRAKDLNADLNSMQLPPIRKERVAAIMNRVQLWFTEKKE